SHLPSLRRRSAKQEILMISWSLQIVARKVSNRDMFTNLSDILETDDEFRDTLLAQKIEACRVPSNLARIVESILIASAEVDKSRNKTQLKFSNFTKLYKSVERVLESYGFAPFRLTIVDGICATYPTLAELHIDETAKRVFGELHRYSSAHQHILKASKLLLENGDIRMGLDECRIGLERFLKDRLSNKKNLSNQAAALGQELSVSGISPSTVTLYTNTDSVCFM
ncbi:hypothetical protein, partial [Deinococcus marmoris]